MNVAIGDTEQSAPIAGDLTYIACAGFVVRVMVFMTRCGVAGMTGAGTITIYFFYF